MPMTAREQLGKLNTPASWSAIAASLILALWPHLFPGSVLDREQVDSSVETALDARIVGAEQKIDMATVRLEQKLDQQTSALRESVQEKVGALRDAVAALKELVLVRINSTELGTQQLQQNQGELKAQLREVERRLRDVEFITRSP